MNEIIKFENSKAILVNEINDRIIAIENEMKILKEQQESYKEALIQAMEANNIKKLENDSLAITYVAETYSERFDSKKFKVEHEELYNDYIAISTIKPSVRIKVKC